MAHSEHPVFSRPTQAARGAAARPSSAGPQSRDEKLIRRGLSPALFALVAIAFFLPFATVSCGDASTTFTGVQLVTKSAPPSGDPDIDEGIGNRAPIGLAVLLAAVTGSVLGIAGIAWFLVRPGFCAAVGVCGTIALPFEPMGPDITLHSGYLVVLGGYVVLAAVHVALAVQGRRGTFVPPSSSRLRQ